MRKLFSKIAFTAALGFAMAFTFSCGEHSIGDDNPVSSSSMEISSSGGDIPSSSSGGNSSSGKAGNSSSSSAQCNATLFAGGDGTEANPYQISTAEQLQNLNECLGSSYRNVYYALTGDIDLTEYLSSAGNNDGAGWQPIGSNSGSKNVFWGKFNGNGYKVFGLWINRESTDCVGLFGAVGDTKISNIGVEIDNSKSGVKGKNYVGGLVGGPINTVTNITITNSYATGDVSGGSYVGGLVGLGWTINDSYATGDVMGTGNFVGGLVGGTNATITNSYTTGNVTGTGGYVGGLAGRTDGATISESYATGDVTGGGDTGGLVGLNYSGTVITNSYAMGSVTGHNAGGLVGANNAHIINSYATGIVNGRMGFGGLVGYINFHVESNEVTNCYYDIITSGMEDSWEEADERWHGTGKSTAAMKTRSTYVGWDFENVWKIDSTKNKGYPILQLNH